MNEYDLKVDAEEMHNALSCLARVKGNYGHEEQLHMAKVNIEGAMQCNAQMIGEAEVKKFLARPRAAKQ